MPMKKSLCVRLNEAPRAARARADFLSERLAALYPDAACALSAGTDAFRLLVMARLSAQCTDKRVNELAPALFCAYPDVRAFAGARQEELEQYVFSTGMYREKARQLIAMSQMLLADFGGEVPRTQKELLRLPGVGTKIANLILGDVFEKPAIVADTHVIRLSNRFAFCESENQHTVERALEKLIEKPMRAVFCHRAVLFCREICSARAPRCEHCSLYAETR